ncbi:UNVERIFIED_CONTAM: hypothetical protein K2H54_040809 [Gekko kuhli]
MVQEHLQWHTLLKKPPCHLENIQDQEHFQWHTLLQAQEHLQWHTLQQTAEQLQGYQRQQTQEYLRGQRYQQKPPNQLENRLVRSSFNHIHNVNTLDFVAKY